MIISESPTGGVVAPPDREERIRALTDAEFCAELNGRPVDPFVYAAWLDSRRGSITWDDQSRFTLNQSA